MTRKYLPSELKPIAIVARKCLQNCIEITARMPQLYKNQIGSIINNLAAKLAASCYASLEEPVQSENKLIYIKRIPENIYYLLIYIRVAKDLNIVQQSKFEDLINHLINMKKQVENWQFSVEGLQQKHQEKLAQIEKEDKELQESQKDEFDDF